MYGPTTVGFPQRHGSIMFWLPCAQRLFPTNTTVAMPKSPIISPVVSQRKTGGAEASPAASILSPRERRMQGKPALRMFASTASAFSKWRGAITSTTSGCAFTRSA